MILTNKGIKEAIQKEEINIYPFEEKHLQQISYNLHLSNNFKIFKQYNTIEQQMQGIILQEKEQFILYPENYVQALIKEKITINNKHLAKIEKNENTPTGLIIQTTKGIINPKTKEQPIIELYNASPQPITLSLDMNIAQITFQKLSQETETINNDFNKEIPPTEKTLLEKQEEELEKELEEKGLKTWK